MLSSNVHVEKASVAPPPPRGRALVGDKRCSDEWQVHAHAESKPPVLFAIACAQIRTSLSQAGRARGESGGSVGRPRPREVRSPEDQGRKGRGEEGTARPSFCLPAGWPRNAVQCWQNCKLGIKMMHVHLLSLRTVVLMSEGWAFWWSSHLQYYSSWESPGLISTNSFLFELPACLECPLPDPAGFDARQRTKGALSEAP